MESWLQDALKAAAKTLDATSDSSRLNNEQTLCEWIAAEVEAVLGPRTVNHQAVANRKRVDLAIPRHNTLIEVKYQRAIPSGLNRPMTMDFGHLLSDFGKLAAIPASHRYIVLATNAPGRTYLLNREILPMALGGSTVLNASLMKGLPLSARRAIDGLDTWKDVTTSLAFCIRLRDGALFAWSLTPKEGSD